MLIFSAIYFSASPFVAFISVNSKKFALEKNMLISLCGNLIISSHASFNLSCFLSLSPLEFNQKYNPAMILLLLLGILEQMSYKIQTNEFPLSLTLFHQYKYYSESLFFPNILLF